MIRTIHAYKYVTKDAIRSRRFSQSLGKRRAVDIYWSHENHNWIVTKKGSDHVFKEYPTEHDIWIGDLQTLWQKHEYQSHLKEEIDLRKIAIQAEKEKAHADRKAENRYALNTGAPYEYEGKRNLALGVKNV